MIDLRRDFKRAIGWNESQSPALIALLATPILLTLWRYRGMAENVDALFGATAGGVEHGSLAYLWQFGSFFTLCLLVPLAVSRGRPVTELGLRVPIPRRALWWTLLAVPLVVAPAAWLGAHMPSVRAAYPMLQALHTRPDLVLQYEAAYVLLYYVAWEFFFRGYLLFTLEAEYGALTAVLIQTMASCLAHIGKPEAEIVGSIPVGVLFGFIALRTRSIWPTFVLHASLGVMTDLFALRA